MTKADMTTSESTQCSPNDARRAVHREFWSTSGATFLVTGGTGSFGRRFVRSLLESQDVAKVVVFSRDELKQFELQQDPFFRDQKERLRWFIGDVRDSDRLSMAMEGVDAVIHAAALKQVPALEYNPFEAVKTNVIGAQNVINAALRNNVSRVVALSTDKAAAPINLYGATKLAADKLFVAANNHRGSRRTLFSVVRYGNVMGSRGSVIPFFRQHAATGRVPVTDPRMTRFTITLDESVEFVLFCLRQMWGGEIFVPKIPSYRILDLVEAVAPGAEVDVVGIRPGEKLHEEMVTQTDSLSTIEFDDYLVILPSYEQWDVEDFMASSGPQTGSPTKEGFGYRSDRNDVFLTVDDLRQLISSEAP